MKMSTKLDCRVSQDTQRYERGSPRACDQFFSIGMEDPPPWRERNNENLVTLSYKFMDLRDEKGLSRAEREADGYVKNFHLAANLNPGRVSAVTV